MRKKKLIGVLIIFGILTIISCAGDISAKSNDYVIAEIGKDKIYFSEIQEMADGLNRFLKENFQTSENWRLTFIRQYVAKVALAKRAKKEGFEKNKEVISAIEKAKQEILTNQILRKALTKLKVTEKDLKKFYKENKEKYQIKEKAKLSYVKFANKRKADRAVEQLNKGKSFKKVAGRKKVKLDEWFSIDSPGFAEGLPELKSQDMNRAISLGVNSSSPAFKVKDGFCIFHVDQKEPAKDKPFEEVKKQVEFEVNKNKKDEIINELLKETYDQEEVRIFENRIKDRMVEEKETSK